MIGELEEALNVRLTADTTLFTLVGTRITNIFGDPKTLIFPYIVFEVTDDSNVDDFTGDGRTATVQVHVFDLTSNGPASCRSILKRIEGDAVLQAGRVPTYGLHRWTPGLQTEWNIGTVQRVTGSAQHERDVLHYVETYRVTGRRSA